MAVALVFQYQEDSEEVIVVFRKLESHFSSEILGRLYFNYICLQPP